jgi:hypothetical protein
MAMFVGRSISDACRILDVNDALKFLNNLIITHSHHLIAFDYFC